MGTSPSRGRPGFDGFSSKPRSPRVADPARSAIDIVRLHEGKEQRRLAWPWPDISPLSSTTCSLGLRDFAPPRASFSINRPEWSPDLHWSRETLQVIGPAPVQWEFCALSTDRWMTDGPRDRVDRGRIREVRAPPPLANGLAHVVDEQGFHRWCKSTRVLSVR
jgi:hypothetical protein